MVRTGTPRAAAGDHTIENILIQLRSRQIAREQIETCLEAPATRQTLEAQIQGAQDAGVDGTPTLFVNGKRVTDHSLAALSAAVEPLLTR